jgi:hypothetical protein
MMHPILAKVRFTIAIEWPDGLVEYRRGFPTRQAAEEHIAKWKLPDAEVFELRSVFGIEYELNRDLRHNNNSKG